MRAVAISIRQMNSLSQMGEHAAIRALTDKLGSNDLLRTGAGDDCAVVKVPGADFDQVFTTDPVIERVHFLPSDDPFLVGSKAAGRVLSDIAAMGAQPQWLLINVVAPSDQNFDALSKIYDGLIAMADQFGATIIGGDLAEGAALELHVFGTGVVPSGEALLRSTAAAGDFIFVTGSLGGSIKGGHLSFTPRVAEGIFLRASGVVNAMMDISDGLATDLRHIIEKSNVGARLKSASIPLTGAAESVANALYDGEDFELLFTVPVEKADDLRASWLERFGAELNLVGVITDSPDVLELQLPDGSMRLLKDKAFEHFT